jgi:hypothetical protein
MSHWILLGAGLGFLLESGGLGNPRKLTGVFRFEDAQILRVLPTAMVTAIAGILLLGLLGADTASWYVPRSQYAAQALGGFLLGVGFYVGGYCPGTGVVGLFSGRLDALAFMAGMVGAWYGWDAWGSIFDPLVRPVPVGRDTVPELLGLDPRIVSAAIAAAGGTAIALFARRELRRTA